VNLRRLEERFQACVDERKLLGAALAVVEGDEVVYANGFGSTTVEPEGVPITPTTLFDVASIAKTVLAAAVMRLVEHGLLDLDRPVLDYLPGFAFSDPDLGARVTLRHLLSHTSGLAAGGKDHGPPDRDALACFVDEQLRHYRFLAEPGRVHQYNSTAICLAGRVAEVVTGTPYRDLVGELVFGPLAMTRSTYDHAVAMTHRVALPHDEDDEDELSTVHRWVDNRSGEPSAFLIAPVFDLANLAVVLLNDGRLRGEPFLSPASVAEMHAQHADRRVRAASHPNAHMWEGYGLGLMRGAYRGARVVRHGGQSQSFENFFDLFPDVRCGFVLLTNWSDDGALAELVFALRDELLGLPEGDAASRSVLPPPAPVAPDRDAWPSHQGTYLSVDLGRLATVAADDDALTLDGRRLTPLAERVYFYEDEGHRVPVELDPPEYLFVGGNAYRRAEPPGSPDRAAWPGWVGQYADPSNLGEGAILALRLEADALHLAGDWCDEALVPFGPTAFLSTLGLIEIDPTESALQVGGATRYYRR
jgi:CubicO group peptidase (beta-lactamase class C family)